MNYLVTLIPFVVLLLILLAVLYNRNSIKETITSTEAVVESDIAKVKEVVGEVETVAASDVKTLETTVEDGAAKIEAPKKS